MSDVKIFKRLAAQIQAGSTYEDSAMFLLPFLSSGLQQSTDPIEDGSIVGLAFKDIPKQGPRHIAGGNSQTLDVVSCAPILQALFGAPASSVYTLTGNPARLSICGLDSVSANQYASQYIKNLKISGSAANLMQLDYDLFGITSVVRAARSAFPASPTVNDDSFSFHEMGGSYGWARVGDAVDALTAADDISIEDFSLEIEGGQDEQFDNDGILSLAPEFGMAGTGCKLSFTVTRFANAQWLTWMDDFVPLQASFRIGKSATKYLQIDIPRFVVKSELTEDEITKVNVTADLSRNGVGTSYKNTNMSFTAPVQITIVNT